MYLRHCTTLVIAQSTCSAVPSRVTSPRHSPHHKPTHSDLDCDREQYGPPRTPLSPGESPAHGATGQEEWRRTRSVSPSGMGRLHLARESSTVDGAAAVPDSYKIKQGRTGGVLQTQLPEGTQSHHANRKGLDPVGGRTVQFLSPVHRVFTDQPKDETEGEGVDCTSLEARDQTMSMLQSSVLDQPTTTTELRRSTLRSAEDSYNLTQVQSSESLISSEHSEQHSLSSTSVSSRRSLPVTLGSASAFLPLVDPQQSTILSVSLPHLGKGGQLQRYNTRYAV